jgi:hypothetical protein
MLLPVAGQGQETAARQGPIRALLVVGGCCHDYSTQKDILTEGISARANVRWTVAYDPDKTTRHRNPVYHTSDWYLGFDVIVHDECSADVTDAAVLDRILKPHREGLPGVLLHCAMHSYRTAGWPRLTPWFEFAGLITTGHGPLEPISVRFSDQESLITRGLKDWTTIGEELYNNPTGGLLRTATPLARGRQVVRDNHGKSVTSDSIVVWTNIYRGKAKARVFGTTLGHNNATVGDPRYLDLVTRGLLWSVGKLDREHLSPPGPPDR